MRRSESVLDRLLRSLPDEREQLRPYVDRAKALSNECGCAMGGAFMVAALVLVIGYEVVAGWAGPSNVLVRVLRDAAIVFGAGVAGKLTGIGIARVRLVWLYRELRVRYVQSIAHP
jgi:hypothetical protein